MASQYHHAAFMNIQRGGGGGVGSLFALRDLWIDGGMDGWMDHEWGKAGVSGGGREAQKVSYVLVAGREREVRCSSLDPLPPSPSITVA